MSDLQNLLENTSRTFALAIPLLPEPTRTDVAIAYLVFRVGDTLEDAEKLRPSERITALQEFVLLLDTPDRLRATEFAEKWSRKDVTENRWYEQLLAKTPFVLDQLGGRETHIQQVVRLHARRTARGMACFLERGTKPLCSVAELQKYCYYVAGIVGEMLTDIFAERIDRFSASHEVRLYAKAFGEGLQLVNILKDSDEDSRSGRLFVPESTQRSALFELARDDLRQANCFVEQLRAAGAEQEYLAFVRLPLELAWATLQQVERFGPGSKVPRDQVHRILHELATTGASRASTRPPLGFPHKRQRVL